MAAMFLSVNPTFKVSRMKTLQDICAFSFVNQDYLTVMPLAFNSYVGTRRDICS